MSHNVRITGVSCKDFVVLASALEELNSEFGTNLSLEVGNRVQSRVWGGARTLPGTVAVIKNGNGNYDITLTQEKDGHIGMQTEALAINELQRAFQLPNSVSDIQNDTTVNPATTGYRNNEELGMRLALGPIMQHYSAILIEQEAAMQGRTSSRVHDKDTGVLNVVINY